MKYYAVTEDPNELFHYGVKGMKWGQHIFGDKPKSPGYKRALGKLRASAKSAKSAIQKSATQHSINKQNRQMDRYNKAVQKAQRNNELVNNLYNLDRVRVNERGLDRDYWGAAKIARIRDKQQQKIDRINNKRIIREAKDAAKYSKNELKMDKIMQLAREGRLKYGQLSDDQVGMVTNRLAIEANARRLGSTEKPKFKTRMKEALQEGMLQGVTQGTAAGMKEIAVAKVQNRLKNKKILDKRSEQEAERQKKANRIRNKKTHKEMREDIMDEAYEAQVRDGTSMWERNGWFTTAQAANALKKVENKRLEDDRKRKLQARINDEMDLNANTDYQKMLSEQRERKRLQDVEDKRATDTEERWQKYLDSEGISDVEARKKAGYSDRAINEVSREEANAQRRAIMEKNERDENEKAFANVTAEIQRRIDNEAKEARNAKREEQFIADMKKYKEDVEHDKKLKDKYDEDMKLYNARKASGYPDINNPMPQTPKYRNPIKPDRKDAKYGFETLDSNAYIPKTNAELQRYRNMGINLDSMFFTKNNNKKGNKKG